MPHPYLGLPVWASRAWVGTFFTPDAKPADFLRQYASVFDTVEGNTTFYHVPSADTVRRWRAETPPHFRFCFKFPREISHGGLVGDVGESALRFLATMEPLGERLGPFFLQLPPSLGPRQLPALAAFLGALPRAFHYAVEVRHPAFFDVAARADALDDLLAGRGVDRVVFDTRGLRRADPADTAVAEAQRRKPDLPVRAVATGAHPFVRYIAHPDPAANSPFFESWADTLAGWIREGRMPYFFVHTPDDADAPPVARALHDALARRAEGVGALPPWPGGMDVPAAGAAAARPTQLGMFD